MKMATLISSKNLPIIFAALDKKLAGATHLVIGGGAAMVLAYQQSLATQNVDGFTAKKSLTLSEIAGPTREVAGWFQIG